MNPFDVFRDQRNPMYLYKACKQLPEHEPPSKIFFLFTMDVELGPDGSYTTAYQNTEAVLDFFNDYGKGTYFIDTDLLEHDAVPPLGKNEVGNHGYQHSAVGNNWWIPTSDKKFDPAFVLSKSTALIKDHLRVRPVSFRAPKFSISKNVFSLLKRHNYTLDSSQAPFNDVLFPYDCEGITEIPVSRLPRPHFYGPLPHLRYDSLMVSLLRDYGVDRFMQVTRGIMSCWQGHNYPMLCFMGHPWEMHTETFDLLRQYLDSLEEIVTLKCVTMKRYHSLTKNN